MKLPVHVWAMLSHGREAESCNVSEWPEAHGFRMRWREYDGERGWTLPDRKGYTPDRFWQESLVQRIMWTKRDGQWYGEWTNWEIYIPNGYDGWRGREAGDAVEGEGAVLGERRGGSGGYVVWGLWLGLRGVGSHFVATLDLV